MKKLFESMRLNLAFLARHMKKLSDPNQCNFLFLIPLAAMALGDNEKAMTHEQLMEAFQGNTVVAELAKGTAYAYVRKGGKTNGLHPTAGKVSGSWKIDDEGVVCVTWPLPNDTIKNCSKTVDLGDGKYNWANQVIKIQKGDPKKLGN